MPTRISADIEAAVNYITRGTGKPYAYEFEPPPGTPRRSATYRDERVRIRNARNVDWKPGLDREGFELRSHRSRVRNFYDEDEVTSVYYPEVTRLVKEATGATSIAIFDHTIRGDKRSVRGGLTIQEPASRVHNDYTTTSAPGRVRDIVPAEEADRLLQHRVVEVNVWRAIRGPLQSFPLGMIDASTLHPDDLVATDLIYRDRIGEIYYVAHSPGHRWYYYPDMYPDEVLLLKCFDSEGTGTRFGAHAAFRHPDTPPDAPARESIEVRTFAFFAPATAPS